MDVRPGGQWRFVAHTTGGEDVDFHGEYREVARPERFVYMFLVGDMPPGDGFVEITVVDRGHRREAAPGRLRERARP